MQSFTATDLGLVRKRNEDAHLRVVLPDPAGGKVFAVADGMGGREAGHIASSLAVETLKEFLMENAAGLGSDPDTGDIARVMSEGIEEAHRRVAAEGSRRAEKTGGRGMGTTLTAVYVNGRRAVYGHVGDSRLYKIESDGRLTRLTDDDGLVEQLLREGSITEEEAREHPKRHVLTQALGLDRHPRVHTGSFRLEPGEGLLLCTDGLTEMLTDEAIEKVLKESPRDPRRLVAEANERGGYDNITAVLVWADGDGGGGEGGSGGEGDAPR